MKAQTCGSLDPPPGLYEDPMTTSKPTSSISTPMLMQTPYFTLALIIGLTIELTRAAPVTPDMKQQGHRGVE